MQPGDTVEEIATKRLGRLQSMEGENPRANETPDVFAPTKWTVFFFDDSEPKAKVFTNVNELRLVKRFSETAQVEIAKADRGNGRTTAAAMNF